MLIFFVIFALGACVGSFVNVLIDRLPEDRSIFTPPSHCQNCNRTLRWFELVPVISWCWLRGKCRTCHTKVSPRIPLVEAFLGIFALFCVWHFDALVSNQNALRALYVFLLASISLAIMLIDFKWWLIPHPLWIAVLLNGLLFRGLLLGEAWLPLVLGALLGLALFTCLLLFFTWLMRKQNRISPDETAMGWGDVWLVAAIGANVGIRLLFVTLLLACLQAVLAWVILWIAQKLKLSTKQQNLPEGVPTNSVPLGTFLALATIEVSLLFF
jgi:leader peptidase (prepilin peptidase)/N-methyltransferase